MNGVYLFCSFNVLQLLWIGFMNCYCVLSNTQGQDDKGQKEKKEGEDEEEDDEAVEEEEEEFSDDGDYNQVFSLKLCI